MSSILEVHYRGHVDVVASGPRRGKQREAWFETAASVRLANAEVEGRGERGENKVMLH
jgi:hypothetical protein